MLRLVALGGALVLGQALGGWQGGPMKARVLPAELSYVAEPAVVEAGRPAVMQVRLQVRQGLHVNSHTPKSDLLIPTVATLTAEDGVRVGAIEYPVGVSYSFASDPGNTLDVYTGAVTLRVPVVALKGEHVLRGTVRYQACNDRSCFPPRTLALEVPFTAR